MQTTVYDLAVIGLGYIGLPTAAIFAAKGKLVAGVDVKQATVDAVNRGEVPFVEPDMGVVVSGAVSLGNLVAMTEVPHANAYIIAVPTPLAEGKGADMSYLTSAVEALAPKLRGGELVILESTSPPGTTERLAAHLARVRPDLWSGAGEGAAQVHVVHSPERVLPGRIMIEMATNDRVIGGLTDEGAQLAKKLYEVICQGEILLTDATTAEMTKLVENTFRDVNIAFANELSVICDKLGIDVWRLIELANHHPRVNVLRPGPGVGGHCIAVDPWFIVDAAPQESGLIRTAREVNDAKPHHVVDRVTGLLTDRESATVAVLGLAFKANIDDVRESPSMTIVQELARRLPLATILPVDPHVEDLPAALENTGITAMHSLPDALATADVVLLLVDHDQFLAVTPQDLEGKLVIDTKGIWNDRQAAVPVQPVLAGADSVG
ncbi:UDP-N-acetyl-D-mannosaminuronic acid dehydrogenase [Arthrobacter sp. Leaf141]|uniref:UDP-N-acetyl-D-mannosamine dehydrogenase n=1 Tax=Micrococcaceae TaxID=1268 RepID=UPI0006FE93BA|nr:MULTISPECIES: UDP-N-acetyl-D-mannosamine dehydrogenase [Micrococcaceae]KQR03488.1 UDP-N-acetyl-D-mannosaminuronic acid dehydrogenase [Arthrobacter sp. Leaf141]